MRTKAWKLQNAILCVGDIVLRLARYNRYDNAYLLSGDTLLSVFCAIRYKHKNICIHYVIAWCNEKYTTNPLPTYEAAEAALVMYQGTIYAWLYYLDMVLFAYKNQIGSV